MNQVIEQLKQLRAQYDAAITALEGIGKPKLGLSYDDITAATVEEIVPKLVDNYYMASPLPLPVASDASGKTLPALAPLPLDNPSAV